ncbi:MAG: hypothetical protein LQ341_004554 [Variospora aurantia]|nr:MAG: hypothetical protein LQ341_004554 [Variospora aurantia]
MATSSTTVLVAGTPDERSTSEAMSVDGEGNPLTCSAMRRRHFELLAAPIAQDDHRYPSSVSFDASLDQLTSNPPRPTPSTAPSLPLGVSTVADAFSAGSGAGSIARCRGAWILDAGLRM